MSETTAVRTLVKSAPELWAACSDAESLARHLGVFGEIQITRLEPETTVAWEGECASGTVTIEPSSWGTKVTMTATFADAVDDQGGAEIEPSAEPHPIAEVEAEPVAEVETDPVAEVQAAPFAQEEPVAEVEPIAVEMEQTVAPVEPVAKMQPVTRPPATGGRRPGLLARLAAWFRGERPQPPVVASEPLPEVDFKPESKPAPPTVAEPEPAPATGVVAEPEPEPAAVTEPAPELQPVTDSQPAPEPASPWPEAALDAALDSLGQAHHRPFSNI